MSIMLNQYNDSNPNGYGLEYIRTPYESIM